MILDRARATSAAPSYFKPFKSERSNRGYSDGPLYHNNPVRVAELERRLIWPDMKSLAPDILLSVGTSCNSNTDQVEGEFRRQQTSPVLDKSILTSPQCRHSIFAWKRQGIPTRKLIEVTKGRVENILDTEITWFRFLLDVVRGDEEARKRYIRINPNIGTELPKLEEVKELPWLRQTIRQKTKDPQYLRQIRSVARLIVASCFYVEISSSNGAAQESVSSIDGRRVTYYTVRELTSSMDQMPISLR